MKQKDNNDPMIQKNPYLLKLRTVSTKKMKKNK